MKGIDQTHTHLDPNPSPSPLVIIRSRQRSCPTPEQGFSGTVYPHRYTPSCLLRHPPHTPLTHLVQLLNQASEVQLLCVCPFPATYPAMHRQPCPAPLPPPRQRTLSNSRTRPLRYSFSASVRSLLPTPLPLTLSRVGSRAMHAARAFANGRESRGHRLVASVTFCQQSFLRC